MSEEPKQNMRTAAQQRITSIITLVTFVIMTAIAFATLLVVPESDKTPIDDITMPLIAVAAGVGYYLTRRKLHTQGIYLLLGAIAFVSAVYPFAADNFGWQTALGMLLLTTGIAYSTLPERTAGWIFTAASGLAIGIILVELFFPGNVSNPVTPSSIVVIVLLVTVYLGIIIYRFNQFGLRTKFVAAFIMLSLVSVGATALAISNLVQRQLTDKISEQLSGVADQTATSIGDQITGHVNLLLALALNESIQDFLAERSAISDFNQLQRLDSQWLDAVSADNNTALIVQGVLDNNTSKQLRDFRDKFPAHAEIFLTDAYGANTAATNRTSDYYQADEVWWQAAYSNGNGAIFISQPIFDESSQTISLQIALPITDEESGELIGILRSNLDLEIFIASLELGRFGSTGRTEIYLPDGREVELHEENGELTLEIEEAPLDFIATLQQNPEATYLDTIHQNEAVLVGLSPVSAMTDTPEMFDTVQRLGWRVATIQNRAEALQTLEDASRTAQLVGLASLVLASLFAVVMTQFMIRPITRLTQAAEDISKGNLAVTAPIESSDEVGALGAAFNRMTAQLRDILLNLENRIAERTADLELSRLQSEMRATQLLSIGEISKIINSEQEMNILLPLITRLVSERFNFYHTGIFLMDEAGQFAILQAANSPGGQVMLKRGHKLKVGERGIVGFVAKSGTARIALDVGQDSAFFKNTDLPNTRSEIALPLKVREKIIGVLDVQSEKPGAFTDEDANLLGILADLVAIAIENTRLFGQTQRALDEARAAYQQNIQEGWMSFGRDESVIGFYQSPSGGRKLARPIVTDEINQSMYRGETLVFHADGKTEEPALVVPIKLREQIIGVLHIKSPARDRLWTTSEINLTEAISERLSLALENARLIQESQRQVIKEQTISEITGRIGSSINLDNVLLTAVEELGRILPGSEVAIKLKNEEKHDDGNR